MEDVQDLEGGDGVAPRLVLVPVPGGGYLGHWIDFGWLMMVGLPRSSPSG